MLLDFVVKPKTEFLRVFVSVFFYLASFSVRRRNSVFRFYKKTSTLTRVVWARDSKTGLEIKTGSRQEKL